MNIRKKALLILVEAAVAGSALDILFLVISNFVKDNDKAQFLFAVILLILAICTTIAVFRLNLKGITWKDIPWKHFFLIPIAGEFLKLLLFHGFLSMLQEVLSPYIGGKWSENIIDYLYKLPWTYFLYYSIASNYYKNRETKKESDNYGV